MSAGDGAGSGPREALRAASWTDAAGKHPFVVILVAVVAVGVVLTAVSALLSGLARATLDATNPYRAEYGGLTALRVAVPQDYVDSLLGDPASVRPLCEVVVCPPDADVTAETTLRVYRGEHSIVRAVFLRQELAAYLVTTRALDFTPRISWLGVDFGRLGRVTFQQVLPSNGAPEPSDASISIGQGTPSYAEVLMGGGASRFEGFLLGSAPGGYRGAGLTWNAQGARELEEWQFENPGGGLDPRAALDFRAGSMPNTYGAFRDEMPLNRYFRDAENVRELLNSPAAP